MNVMDYVQSALRHWRTIVLAGLLAATAGLLFAREQPAQFQTRARYVISPSPQVTDDNDIAQSLDALSNRRAIVSTFAQVVLSQKSFDNATRAVGASRKDADRLKISTAASPEANVVEVFVLGPRPQLIETVLELIGAESTRSFQALYTIYAVEALDVAGPKTEKVAPKPLRSTAIGGFLGGALAFLIGLVGDRIKADRARASGSTEEPEHRAAPPDPDPPGKAPVAAPPAQIGPGETAELDGGPGRGLMLHPVSRRSADEHPVVTATANGPTAQLGPLREARVWLGELDDLAWEVRRWPHHIAATADMEDAQQRWRSELDDLGGLLRAWTETTWEGSERHGRPDGPTLT